MRMRITIIILNIVFFSVHLVAQEIELTILPHSVNMQNDSLYFRYRIQNISDTILVLYNVRSFEVADDENPFDDILTENSKFKYSPRLFLFIYNKRREFQPKDFFVMMKYQDPRKPIIKTYEDSIHSISEGKYIVLKQGESIEYDRMIPLGENIRLPKGSYEFQIGYFSSGYFRQRYAKAKKKDNRLKNSMMFEGEVRSNFCVFEFP